MVGGAEPLSNALRPRSLVDWRIRHREESAFHLYGFGGDRISAGLRVQSSDVAVPGEPDLALGGRPLDPFGIRPGGRPQLAPGLLFVAVSIAGFANALPGQGRVYKAWSRETGAVAFVRNQDPIFAAYRCLAGAPGVRGVWQVDRPYFNLPEYYHLHQDVPLYDQHTGLEVIGTDAEGIRATVSHIVSGDPATSIPGYSVEREFGGIRILRRDDNGGDVRNWEARTPTIVPDLVVRTMEQVASSPPSPPENAGIRFVGPDQPQGAPP